jgi:outer membrane protein assembly factor BamD (BamD/ComL family)
MSVQEHYSAAMDAYQKKDWEELVHQANVIIKNFPSTPFAAESIFYLGAAYFHLREYEMANKEFSTYLKRHSTPKHFEEAIQYKFSIAEKFQNGSKKRVLGWESMPKIIPAQEDALEIYEEVITALPHDDLAAKALFGKAKLFFKEKEFKSSVEAYQTIIRRFPKNSLAAESYVGIGEVYLTQCQKEYPDPDFLDLAEINLRKFKIDFPSEEKIALAEKMLLEMQEIYAQSLYETAQFFERTKKPHASIIYYNKIVSQYPGTQTAKVSEKRLNELQEKRKDKKQRTPKVVEPIEVKQFQEEESLELSGSEVQQSIVKSTPAALEETAPAALNNSNQPSETAEDKTESNFEVVR